MSKYKAFLWATVIIWALFGAWVLCFRYEAPEEPVEEEPEIVLPVVEVICTGDVNKEAVEPVSYEDWFVENANVIPGCKITHYCAEPYKHICGTGDALTSTGVPVTAGWTCAVDPSVIPYGAEVMVDYGGTVEFWKAQDCGGAIKGNHIDLAVETHSEAEELGVKYATVYWMEVNHEFG